MPGHMRTGGGNDEARQGLETTAGDFQGAVSSQGVLVNPWRSFLGAAHPTSATVAGEVVRGAEYQACHADGRVGRWTCGGPVI
jgi:hypothetical protein